jgi:hypothetical protein
VTTRPARDPIRPPDTDEYLCPNCLTPWKCNGPHIPEPSVDRANRERARYLALVCFGLLLALVAAAAWWSQR